MPAGLRRIWLVEIGIDVAVALLGPDVGIFLDFDLGVDDVDVLGAVTLFGADTGSSSNLTMICSVLAVRPACANYLPTRIFYAPYSVLPARSRFS